MWSRDKELDECPFPNAGQLTKALAMRSGFICSAVAPLQFRPASENHRIFLVRNFISAYGLGVL